MTSILLPHGYRATAATGHGAAHSRPDDRARCDRASSSACAYAGAAQLVLTPRVHPDEHIYWLGGAALAAGEGLTLRGEDYVLGPVYPAVLAGVLTLAPDRETAYHLVKVANALLFALAAIPIFLVARRLLTRWWSVGVAAMSLAVPSSLYVSLVMTESVSYFVFSLAIYAIVLALERSTVLRQLAAIAAIALAYETRAQFAVLFAAYLAALGLVWAMARDRRAAAVRPSPTCGRRSPPLALGVAAFVVRPLVTGGVSCRRCRRLLRPLPRIRPARHRQVDRLPPRRISRSTSRSFRSRSLRS